MRTLLALGIAVALTGCGNDTDSATDICDLIQTELEDLTTGSKFERLEAAANATATDVAIEQGLDPDQVRETCGSDLIDNYVTAISAAADL